MYVFSDVVRKNLRGGGSWIHMSCTYETYNTQIISEILFKKRYRHGREWGGKVLYIYMYVFFEMHRVRFMTTWSMITGFLFFEKLK